MSAVAGPSHSSPAWLHHGMAVSTPGVLVLQAGRLSFVSDDGTIFDEPLAEVHDVHFPWYGASWGFRATIGGRRRWIWLTRPSGADGGSALGSGLGAVRASRRRGKAWRALLGAYD